MKKKPRFFCDNCGSEVGRDQKNCPNCGRFFAAVRCPSCGYTGSDEMFQGGCPMCGYSAPPPPDSKNAKPDKKKKKPSWISGSSEPLPAWTYIISIIVLFALIAFISYFITK